MQGLPQYTRLEEIVNEIAKRTGIAKRDILRVLDAYFKITAGVLKKKGKVQLVNFGTFSVAKRAQRKGVNPRTKKPIIIPAKMVPKFTPGKMLKEAVKGLK